MSAEGRFDIQLERACVRTFAQGTRAHAHHGWVRRRAIGGEGNPVSAGSSGLCREARGGPSGGRAGALAYFPAVT